MTGELFVGVIGDFNHNSKTHAATNLAFHHAATHMGVSVDIEWVSTLALEEREEDRLDKFDALLCAPGSPYRSMRGALNGIRFAREGHRPLWALAGDSNTSSSSTPVT